MDLPQYENISAHRYTKEGFSRETMDVSTEYPLLLVINSEPYSTIACSGENISELVTGHLYSESIIQSPEDITDIRVDEENLTVFITIIERRNQEDPSPPLRNIVTAGGRSVISMPPLHLKRESLPPIKGSIIIEAMNNFLMASSLHDRTHGVHSGSLIDQKGAVILFFDEIGRHNAIDKIIGKSLREKIPLHDKILLTTGRISSEIARKVVISSIPVLISRASPTSYAVDILKEFNILTVVRAKKDTFLVIHGRDSILI